MKIVYLKNAEIDRNKWDECIMKSENMLMFSLSWYLDVVSPGWDALVGNNYEAVMPLTWKKRYKLYYLIQPQFSQQLGVFSTVKKDLTKSFLRKIPHKFVFTNICLNSKSNDIPQKYLTISRVNYILPLHLHYENLQKKYNRSTKTNLKKSSEHNIHIRDFDLIAGIDFLAREYNNLLEIFDQPQKQIFIEIVKHANRNGKVDCIGAFYENKLMAVVIAIIAGSHISIQTIASEEGKKLRTLFQLYDFLIQRYSNKQLIIDFGGSDIDSIAYFFNGFGSTKCYYYQIKHSYFIPKNII